MRGLLGQKGGGDECIESTSNAGDPIRIGLEYGNRFLYIMFLSPHELPSVTPTDFTGVTPGIYPNHLCYEVFQTSNGQPRHDGTLIRLLHPSFSLSTGILVIPFSYLLHATMIRCSLSATMSWNLSEPSAATVQPPTTSHTLLLSSMA